MPKFRRTSYGRGELAYSPAELSVLLTRPDVLALPPLATVPRETIERHIRAGTPLYLTVPMQGAYAPTPRLARGPARRRRGT